MHYYIKEQVRFEPTTGIIVKIENRDLEAYSYGFPEISKRSVFFEPELSATASELLKKLEEKA